VYFFTGTTAIDGERVIEEVVVYLVCVGFGGYGFEDGAGKGLK
jgi:hypothetical protein